MIDALAVADDIISQGDTQKFISILQHLLAAMLFARMR
jgi:hypothetical protein